MAVAWLAMIWAPSGALAGPWSQVDLHAADTLVEGYTYDRLGTDVVAGDLNDDGAEDLVVSALDAVLVYFGPVPPGPLSRGDADVEIPGDPGSLFGRSVAIGDVLGDGLPDLIVGAPTQDQLGAVFLFEGPLQPGATWGAAHRIDGFELVAGEEPWTGYAVAAANVDGVGKDELVVGCPLSRSGLGDVFVVEDPASHSFVRGAQFVGVGMLGWSVANAGDLNGDGMEEVALGAPLHDSAGTDAGEVVLVYGHPNLTATMGLGVPVWKPPSGQGNSTLPIGFTRIQGDQAGAALGWSVGAAHDLNDDGYDDLLIGAPGRRGGTSGAVHALLGGADRGPDPVLDRPIVGVNPVQQVRGTTWTGGLGVGVDVDGAGDTSPGLWGAEVLIGSDADGAWLRPWTLSIVSVSYDCQWDPDTEFVTCYGPIATIGTPPVQQVIALGSGLEGHFTSPFALPGGAVVAGVGDLSGDGVDDLAFGEPILTWLPDIGDEPLECTEPVFCAGKVAVVYGQP